ncbi:MAG: hypothetical protein ACE5KX_05350 [Acidimicrobiia bacterium]
MTTWVCLSSVRRAGLRTGAWWSPSSPLAVAGFGLAIAGPGSMSVDAAIGIADALDGWAGLIIALAG